MSINADIYYEIAQYLDYNEIIKLKTVSREMRDRICDCDFKELRRKKRKEYYQKYLLQLLLEPGNNTLYLVIIDKDGNEYMVVTQQKQKKSERKIELTEMARCIIDMIKLFASEFKKGDEDVEERIREGIEKGYQIKMRWVPNMLEEHTFTHLRRMRGEYEYEIERYAKLIKCKGVIYDQKKGEIVIETDLYSKGKRKREENKGKWCIIM